MNNLRTNKFKQNFKANSQNCKFLLSSPSRVVFNGLVSLRCEDKKASHMVRQLVLYLLNFSDNLTSSLKLLIYNPEQVSAVGTKSLSRALDPVRDDRSNQQVDKEN